MAWYRKTEWMASRTRSIAAEGERHVRHAAGRSRPGELLLQPADGLDEGDRVGVVLLHPGRDREDVRVEDDVLGRKPDVARQQVVGAAQDGDPPFDRFRLALLVEGHDNDGGPVAPAEAGLPQELVLALLERDRVHDPLALELLQPGLDHRPFRAVDHDRGDRDVRLGSDPAQEAGHRRRAVEHRLVHVHVDELGAVRDLLPGDVDRLVLGAGGNQPRELPGAGDVRPLADIDERVARPAGSRAGQGRTAGSCRPARGSARGGRPATASAIAATCAGVDPQQLPATFSSPWRAHSPIAAAISSGVSSYPPSSFGRPAFG